MDTSELRVGNLLHYKEDTVIVSGINPSECFVIRDKDLVMTGIDNLNPIPLTKEWLLRFGFVKKEDQKYYHFKFDRTWVSIDSVLVKWYGNDVGGLTMINYVHQLQNLFFALEDEELQLK